MNYACIDTNVITRYLVETPQTIDIKFKGVYSFFSKLEQGSHKAILPEIVLFQAYFVLTSFYKVPSAIAAEKLAGIVSFRGIAMQEKNSVIACLKLLQKDKIDIVDAYLLAYSEEKGVKGVYSFDSDLSKRGLVRLKVE